MLLSAVTAVQGDCGAVYPRRAWTKSCYCKAARASPDPPVPGKLAAPATRNKSDFKQLQKLFSK